MKVHCIALLVALSFALIFVQPGDAKANKHRKCGQYEEWKDCGFLPGCVNTCATKDIKFKCKEDCTPGCFCIKPKTSPDMYIRECPGGPCILRSDCPPTNKTASGTS